MPPLVWLLQMYLVSIWVLNWSAEQGYFDLIWNFMGIIGVVSLFFNGALGAISESYSHKKFKLTELYITEGFKWGNFFLFFMVSILAAVGDKIIIGASGPTWARATIYIIPLLIFHFFGPISWLGDTVFEGTGRTDLAAYSWILEQILRALFLILFLHPEGPFRLGMLGVLLAYIPALIIKDIFLLAMIYKKVIKFKFYWYLNLLSMAIAAFVNFTLLYYLGEFIWNNIAQGILGALILMLVGMFGFLYIFAFLVGVFGGWDEHLLNEFKRSVKMMKGVRGFGNLLLRITEMGCRISPLHNKFPCDIWPIAMEEADALTKEKLVLEL
jgi:O-antigen/teichoic acid export membrane protein